MEEPLSTSRRVWPLVAFILVFALALRVWQVANTEVTARDSVGYVRIAWRLEHGDWRQVIPTSPHHPGYPLSILAVSSLVRKVQPGTLPDVMQLSAQIASSIASVLLVLPMFYLGRALFDRRIAFWSTLLFQCLPASSRLLADGLSESLFLLFATTAFWLAVVSFQRRSPWYFAGVGLFGALAYLTRPEGALIVAATGIVLALLQLRRATRRPWRAFAGSAISLGAAALLLAGPFMVLIHGVTTKNTPIKLFKSAPATSNDHPTRPPAVSSVATHPAVFAVFWDNKPGSGDASQRRVWALTTMLGVLAKLFYYYGWFPLLLGLWAHRHRFRDVPGAWVIGLVTLMLLLLLYLVALKMGYLSDRHALLLLCCGNYWSMAGVLWLGESCAGFFTRWRWVRPKLWGTTLATTACALGLMHTLQPMHGERAGFREAGYWLAEHAQPSDDIDDPYTWASYYAGRYFVEQLPPHQRGTPHCVYVVFEKSSNKHSEVPLDFDIENVIAHGDRIHSWPVRRRHETAEIVLYKVTY